MSQDKQLKLLSVRVTDDVKLQVDEEARAQRLSVSQFVRRAVLLALKPATRQQ